MDTTRPSLLIRIRDPADSDSWREFDRLYRPILLRYSRMRGLSESDAEDLTQHCLSLVIRHIRGFEYDPAKGRFKGWLRTMVNNRVRSLMRTPRPDAAESQDFKRPQEREPQPEELFDKVWQEEHLKHCLKLIRAEVSNSSFQAFQYSVIDGWPIEKVCETCKMTANQVYQIKWRVLQKLRARMTELVGSDE